ncbi:hypothetical protein [Variovorax sp. LjRoot175]|uniref:hypothetical protein n=1 Tax=Variovorax sp. LjRoot175 TaxID=3342276 RepID=UPI003F516718
MGGVAYPIQIGGGWIALPQAQLTYQRINPDESADIAALVRFRTSESLAGQMGAASPGPGRWTKATSCGP